MDPPATARRRDHASGSTEVLDRTSIRETVWAVVLSLLRTSINRGPNDVNHRKLARALAARSTSEGVGPERRQRPSSDLRRSPAPAKDRPSRATRLLASESTPRGDILALQPVHRSRWTACRRGSAAPPTMVLEENVRVSCISLPALLGGKAAWRSPCARERGAFVLAEGRSWGRAPAQRGWLGSGGAAGAR